MESRENRELCRNCKDRTLVTIQARYMTNKTSEQKQVTFCPLLLSSKKGNNMSKVGQVVNTEQDFDLWEQECVECVVPPDFVPEVMLVTELHEDIRAKEKAAHLIGSVALGATTEVESDKTDKPIRSLYDALTLAKDGEIEAKRVVESNVSTDVIERTIKTGHVMKPLPLHVSSDGKIHQYGQRLDSIQANSLRYASDNPVMRARTEAEVTNSYRLEELNRTGQLDDYNFVVISKAENLPEYGFFTDTMSCSIQVVTKDDTGHLSQESAFVAGKSSVDGELHIDQTVNKLGQRVGVDYAGKTTAEIIGMPLLVHKNKMPNGVIDFVKFIDDCAGGTFFGEDRLAQDYLEYQKECYLREASFLPKIQTITEELIARSEEITSPLAATRVLSSISGNHMVEYAISDTTINPNVFGMVSAGYIEKARQAQMIGDVQNINHFMGLAKKHEQSSSCPSADKNPAGIDEDELGIVSSKDEDQYGSLTFKCRKGHNNRRPKGKLIENCQVCHESVRC